MQRHSSAPTRTRRSLPVVALIVVAIAVIGMLVLLGSARDGAVTEGSATQPPADPVAAETTAPTFTAAAETSAPAALDDVPAPTPTTTADDGRANVPVTAASENDRGIDTAAVVDEDATRLTPPAGCTSIAHIGDSTSSQMVPELEAAYGRSRFGGAHVRAFGGRNVLMKLPDDPETGQQAAMNLRSMGFDGCFVVGLGTNDTAMVELGYNIDFTRREAIDAMMTAIDPGGETPVMWVNAWTTVTDPTDVFRPETMQIWNDELVAATERWPNLLIADWAGLAAQHPEWFADDGIHYNDAGHTARAAFFVDHAERLLG